MIILKKILCVLKKNYFDVDQTSQHFLFLNCEFTKKKKTYFDFDFFFFCFNFYNLFLWRGFECAPNTMFLDLRLER